MASKPTQVQAQDVSLAAKRQALQLAVGNNTVIPVSPSVAAAPYRRILPNFGASSGNSPSGWIDINQLPTSHPFNLRATPIKNYAKPIA